QRRAWLLTDDRDERLVVLARVVETVDQVDRSRPRRGDADPRPTGEFRVGARHERGRFLVPCLDEVEAPGLRAAERAEEAVDTVAGVAEDAVHAPTAEPLENEVTDGAAYAVHGTGHAQQALR